MVPWVSAGQTPYQLQNLIGIINYLIKRIYTSQLSDHIYLISSGTPTVISRNEALISLLKVTIQIIKHRSMEKQQISISMPQMGMLKYKNNVKEIEDLVKELNNLTGNLQSKVNNMLKGQETQFVNSYKQHMNKIEEVLKEYQLRIQDYQKKIEHYQNEGMLSILLKKISFLQSNERKLLTHHQKKDRIISILKGEITTQQRQILSLQAKIKGLMLNNPSNLQNTSKPSQRTFATQIQTIDKHFLKSNNSNQYLNAQTLQYQTINPHLQTMANPEQTQNHNETELKRAKRQMQSLKKKNRQLSSVNSKIIEKATSIEQFFVKTVDDLKKKIRGRKNLNPCTYEDFKQQDKLQLLVKILSNEEILQHLYNKIFNKVPRYDLQGVRMEEREQQRASELGRSERVVSRLPAIASVRR